MEQIKVIVRPNSRKNILLGFDTVKQAYRVNLKASAEKGEANAALVKFLSKEMGKKVRIKSGLRSKEKIIEIG